MDSSDELMREAREKIQAILETLQRDARALTVLVVDKRGQLIASAGDVETVAESSLSSLVAGNVSATG
ncbi:MAG: hypothetical protein H6713_17675 [Myxococcales bacterium]|nr:hypothetical protein [Myxococcales bacterium]MCB9751807.1 hypothetical protein [Myxococcales bacterium]